MKRTQQTASKDSGSQSQGEWKIQRWQRRKQQRKEKQAQKKSSQQKPSQGGTYTSNSSASTKTVKRQQQRAVQRVKRRQANEAPRPNFDHSTVEDPKPYNDRGDAADADDKVIPLSDADTERCVDLIQQQNTLPSNSIYGLVQQFPGMFDFGIDMNGQVQFILKRGASISDYYYGSDSDDSDDDDRDDDACDCDNCRRGNRSASDDDSDDDSDDIWD